MTEQQETHMDREPETVGAREQAYHPTEVATTEWTPPPADPELMGVIDKGYTPPTDTGQNGHAK